jgi:hypothetical protein
MSTFLPVVVVHSVEDLERHGGIIIYYVRPYVFFTEVRDSSFNEIILTAILMLFKLPTLLLISLDIRRIDYLLTTGLRTV